MKDLREVLKNEYIELVKWHKITSPPFPLTEMQSHEIWSGDPVNIDNSTKIYFEIDRNDHDRIVKIAINVLVHQNGTTQNIRGEFVNVDNDMFAKNFIPKKRYIKNIMIHNPFYILDSYRHNL